MDTTIVPPKKFDKKTMQTDVKVPPAKGGLEIVYPFLWLLFKPQAHAVVPFLTNEQTRLENVYRKSK
jgi:hypothetical protein